MRHYVLTRAAYGPELPLEFNRYRLDLMRGITVASLAAQTNRDVTWLILIDPADPLIEERRQVIESAGLPYVTASPGDMDRSDRRDRPWTSAWCDSLDFADATLTTRIDDDDAFAPWALAAFREKAEQWCKVPRYRRRRRIFVLPVGYRVSGGRVNLRRDRVNQFTSLYAPKGDRKCIMDMNHTGQRRLAPLTEISVNPGWLWLRHAGARSHMSRASNLGAASMVPVPDEVRFAFPVDWPLIESL